MAAEQIACTPAAINAAAASPEVVIRLELLVTDWCDLVRVRARARVRASCS